MESISGLSSQNGLGLQKNQNEEDLVFDIGLLFWNFIQSIWKNICKDGKLQNGHCDMVLNSMQEDYGAQFRKEWELLLKEGIRMFWSNLTICQMAKYLIFDLSFFDSVGCSMSQEMF